MSLYRFARTAALLTLLRRYRARLLRMLFAVAFALTSAWVYADIAAYLETRAPAWLGPALLLKTAIVYAALLWCFWELSRMLRGRQDPDLAAPEERPRASGGARATGAARASGAAAPAAAPADSRLEALAQKPKLRSRREDLLHRPAKPR